MKHVLSTFPKKFNVDAQINDMAGFAQACTIFWIQQLAIRTQQHINKPMLSCKAGVKKTKLNCLTEPQVNIQ